ncbi:hypothetical protein V8E54_014143 [Elaphomyces granulatus]
MSTTSTQLEAPTPSSITSIQGEDPNDLKDKKILNPRQGRVSRMANPSSMPIASNITAIPKTTVPTGPSPNTIPRLLYEDLQDSNVDLDPNGNVWYRPPKTFSAPALRSSHQQ